MIAIKRTGTDSLPELIDQYAHHAFGFAVENFYARVLGVLRAESRPGLAINKKSPDPLAYDLVPLPISYTLSTLSRKLGMAPEMLVAINPAWTERVEKNRIKIPKNYLLRVPKDSETVVRETLNVPKSTSIPEKNKIVSAH